MKQPINLIDSVWDMSKFIVERSLIYHDLKTCRQGKVTIGINKPYFLKKGDVDFPFDQGAAACKVEFIGLDIDDVTYYGADKLQALEFAIDIDPVLRKFTDSFSFFCEDGGEYF